MLQHVFVAGTKVVLLRTQPVSPLESVASSTYLTYRYTTFDINPARQPKQLTLLSRRASIVMSS
jgi:hypothetical protein